jgi:hypothetical protein
MSLEGNVDYALTRVQSQHGGRPDVNEWRRLEASHDLGQYLEATRSGIFGSWVSSLDRKRDAHAIERTLRAAWRSYVRTVAAWHPRRWQPWLTWLEWLPTLGLISRLEDAAPMPAWLLADPVFERGTGETSAERLAALKGTALAVYEPAISGRVPLGELWLTHWQALRPPVDAFTEQLLAKVLRAVQEHARILAEEGAHGVGLRDQLRERIEKLFRAAAGTIVATLCHLALVALDFERLRGGLVDRSLFARGG